MNLARLRVHAYARGNKTVDGREERKKEREKGKEKEEKRRRRIHFM